MNALDRRSPRSLRARLSRARVEAHPRRFAPSSTRSLPSRHQLRFVPVACALLFLSLVLVDDRRSTAAPAGPDGTDDRILIDGGYGLMDEWTETDAARRVVVGQDKKIYVLGGVYIRHMRSDGSIEEMTRVEDIKEIEVGDKGELFAAKTKEIMQVRPGDGSVVWRKALPTDPHPVVGPRPPYVAAITFDKFAKEIHVLYDEWDDIGNRTLIDDYALDGFGKRNGHSLKDQTHSYWDHEIFEFDEYILNRSTQSVEVYRGDEYLKSIPLPVPARRMAVGPDGSIFVVSERQWVYRVDFEGRLLDVWDATDPTPGIQSWVTDIDVDDIGRVYVTDPAKATVRIYAPVPGRSNPPPPEQRWFCQTRPDKSATPNFLQLGEKTKVSLKLNGDCPSLYEKADIMLVVDRSNSMTGAKIEAAKLAVETFVKLMNLKRDKVGLVMYQNEAELLVPLTHDPQRILDAIPRLTPTGGTNIADALDLSMVEMLGPNHRPEAKPIMVLLTDGVPFNNTRLLTLETADRVRDAGITLYTVGLGGDADPYLLAIMARSLEHYFFAPTAAELEEVYRKIAQRIAAKVLLKEVTVVDIVPPNMAYQEDSAEPPAVWNAANRSLTWRFTDVPFEGVEMSFWVEPLEVGEHPTNIGADYDGTDGLDQPNHGVFPIPKVIVVSPGLPPTQTPTTTPSPTPTQTATEPPPPVKPSPIYLPIMFNDKCIPQYTDVILILDNSTTMKGRMDDGRLKLEGAKDAARAFVSMLQLEPDGLDRHDQAAIIWYNDIAKTEQKLTNDRAALGRAIDRIQSPDEGSRIDLGLQYAHQQLIATSGRRAGNTPAIVLLSDGEPNRTTLEAVYDAANELKREGAVVFTVGFKDTFFREHVLRYIASGDDKYFYSPRAEDLAGIYQQIAGKLVCKGGRK